jgi:predicted Rossmann fold flavoprotein
LSYKYNIAVIGAGASGMMASIFALQNGHSITIFEKNSKVGKKILASGNGRCNITNKNPKLENYHSSNIEIAQKILDRFSTKDTQKFFFDIGLPLVEGEKQNRLYPMSLQATSVADLLYRRLIELGANILLDTAIVKIIHKDKFTLFADSSKKYSFDKVIISAGSKAQSKLGGSLDGYRFADYFGHKIEETNPSLVQLVSNSPYLKHISGVRFVGSARLFVDNKNIANSTGDILFTKYGLSGSSILEISRGASVATQKSNQIRVELDLIPDISDDRLMDMLAKRIISLKSKTVFALLEGFTNKKLINMILKETKISSNKISESLQKNELGRLGYVFKHLSFDIIDTKGYDFCEVSTGGVSLKDVEPKSMESKLCKGVYFCGEVLDVDGDCGGFNLQWAWSSGYVAGISV